MPNIDHVDLVVTSLDASLPFYEAVLTQLGFNRRAQIVGERGETVQYVSDKGSGCAIGLRERQSDAHERPYDRYGIGVHHVCVRVESKDLVDALADWLRANGHAIESGPERY